MTKSLSLGPKARVKSLFQGVCSSECLDAEGLCHRSLCSEAL